MHLKEKHIKSQFKEYKQLETKLSFKLDFFSFFKSTFNLVCTNAELVIARCSFDTYIRHIVSVSVEKYTSTNHAQKLEAVQLNRLSILGSVPALGNVVLYNHIRVKLLPHVMVQFN